MKSKEAGCPAPLISLSSAYIGLAVIIWQSLQTRIFLQQEALKGPCLGPEYLSKVDYFSAIAFWKQRTVFSRPQAPVFGRVKALGFFP